MNKTKIEDFQYLLNCINYNIDNSFEDLKKIDNNDVKKFLLTSSFTHMYSLRIYLQDLINYYKSENEE